MGFVVPTPSYISESFRTGCSDLQYLKKSLKAFVDTHDFRYFF
jgi:hypothetical protein